MKEEQASFARERSVQSNFPFECLAFFVNQYKQNFDEIHMKIHRFSENYLIIVKKKRTEKSEVGRKDDWNLINFVCGNYWETNQKRDNKEVKQEREGDNRS